MKQEIRAALVNGDVAVLKKHGRFLNAFLREMENEPQELPMSEAAREFLRISYNQAAVEPPKISCSE